MKFENEIWNRFVRQRTSAQKTCCTSRHKGLQTRPNHPAHSLHLAPVTAVTAAVEGQLEP